MEQAPPHFFQHDHEVEEAEARSAVLLRDAETEPAQIRELRPKGEGQSFAPLGDRSYCGQAAFAIKKLTNTRAQDLLVLAEKHVHLYRLRKTTDQSVRFSHPLPHDLQRHPERATPPGSPCEVHPKGFCRGGHAPRSAVQPRTVPWPGPLPR